MKKLFILVLLVLVTGHRHMDARKFSVSTNVMDYINLGTLNLEASYGFSQHWSLNAGAKFNPFTFKLKDDGSQMQNRQQSYEIGVRLWPWLFKSLKNFLIPIFPYLYAAIKLRNSSIPYGSASDGGVR